MDRHPGQPDQRLNYLSDRYAYQTSNGTPQPGGSPAMGGPPQPGVGNYQGYVPQAYPSQYGIYGGAINPNNPQPAAYGHYAQPVASPAAQAYGYGHIPGHQHVSQPAAMGHMPMGQPPPLPLALQNEERIVGALRNLFPDVKEHTLRTAARVYHTFEAASDWLTTMKRQGMLASIETTARRPAMSIREKFAHRAGSQAQQVPMTAHRVSAAASPAPAAKKRLTKKYDDEFSASDDSEDGEEYDAHGQYEFEQRVLKFLNTAPRESIIDVTGCTDEMVDALLKKRPYNTLFQAQKVDVPSATPQPAEQKRKRGASKKSAGSKIVDASLSTLRGYEAVDSLIQECAKLGKDVQRGIQAWGVDLKGAAGDELEIVDIDADNTGGYFKEPPRLMAEGVELKNYQQVGINWLALLYNRKLSCILADEMGLGKTCQIISFFAHLKEIGERGPHLVVCPSSTLENWLRELNRFCPDLVVEPYYGSQNERTEIREAIIASGANFDVMVTTYNLATGGKQDMGFLKSMRFNVCVYDEGHLLKNSQSERYNKLMKLKANFRVLLTGTPLQNNLRELVSLLSFILPSLFEQNKEDLLEVFKFKAKTKASPQEQDTRSQLLSEQRIIKAKTMMAPFILRRRKDQVLQLLPPKSHEVVVCEMGQDQRNLYQKELKKNKKSIRSANDEVKADTEAGKTATKKGKQATLALDNVLMQLRKAALHPLLFRVHYDDAKLKKMTRDIMQEDQYKTANKDYIFEDMQYMNDFELNRLCHNFPASVGRYMLDDEMYMQSGKVQKLAKLLLPMKEQNDRILIFSQFTLVLDILEKVLTRLNISFLRMDGQTPVEERQDLIDRFHDEDISVFLLSTKAGGFGINLAVANVVIIFDLSFNPHDDKQAEDRAHRVGQTRPVRVIRMVTKDSIEESIMELANTKLALDRHVSEENDEVDAETEAFVADMVLDSAPTRAQSEVPSLSKSRTTTPVLSDSDENASDDSDGDNDLSDGPDARAAPADEHTAQTSNGAYVVTLKYKNE